MKKSSGLKRTDTSLEKSLEKATRHAIAFLEKQGYRYAVIGGLANQHWGILRLTKDVDIKVLVPDTDYPAVRETIRAKFPERGRPDTSVNPLIVDTRIDNVIVDFILAIPGYEENIITRATRRKLGKLTLWICSAEDLIIQKAVANRGKDWQDVEGILIEQYEHLDYAYIEGWLDQFAEILERPEMLEQYRQIQQHIKQVVEQHSKKR